MAETVKRIPERKTCVWLSTRRPEPVMCLGENCGTWDSVNKMCGLLTIAKALDILSYHIVKGR